MLQLVLYMAQREISYLRFINIFHFNSFVLDSHQSIFTVVHKRYFVICDLTPFFQGHLGQWQEI